MTLSDQDLAGHLEQYREYLLLLARMQIGPTLRIKYDEADIVQQTLLRAYENRSQFLGSTQGELLAWLRTILANVMASAARHYHTEGRDLGREYHWQADVDASASRIDGFLAADQTSPSERAVRAEELVRLAQALNQLLPDEKRAVEYHHLRGLPISEVATLMGRTRPAIAGLLFRGLRRLRELLPDQTPRFSG